MPKLIVNKNTGEIDADCPICGHGIFCGHEDFIPPDDSHMVLEIDNKEHEQLIMSIEKINNKFSYAVRIDMAKAHTFLDEREQIKTPIEIDGIGGKEIIGFNQKPESIIIKRRAPVK